MLDTQLARKNRAKAEGTRSLRARKLLSNAARQRKSEFENK
jgi:hypothetical protein